MQPRKVAVAVMAGAMVVVTEAEVISMVVAMAAGTSAAMVDGILAAARATSADATSLAGHSIPSGSRASAAIVLSRCAAP
jgi:hypothetical protein